MRGPSLVFLAGAIVVIVCGIARAQESYNADSVEQVFDSLADSVKIREANNLMKFYLDVDFAKSTYYAEQAFAMESKVSNKKDVAMTYISWAIAQYNFGRYDEALSYNMKALGIYEPVGDSTAIATAYNNIGITYNALGDYSTAAYYSFKALDIHERKKNWRKAAISCLNISSSFYESKNYDKTLTWARQAHRYYTLVNQPDQLGYAFQMFIDAHLALHQPDSAKFYLNKVRSLNRQYPNEYLETVNLSQRGEVYVSEKKYDSAIYVCNKVLDFYRDLEMDDAVLHTRLTLSRVYADLRDFDRALKFANQVYEVSNRIRNKVMIVKSAGMLSDIYVAQGRYDKSIVYSNTASTYKDSLMLRSLQGSIEGRMLDVKLEKETNARLGAITALEKQSVLIGRQTLIIIIIAAGLLGMLFIMLLVRREGLYRKKLSDQLYEKNERLSELNSEINGLVNTIIHDLKSPLNSVQGLLSVMEITDGTKQERQQLIDLAKKTIGNGHDIIRQLLELREVEENPRGLAVSEFDTYELLEDVYRAFRPIAAKKLIGFTFDGEHFVLKSDKLQVRRVLDNLVSNAIKFSAEGANVNLSVGRENGIVTFRVSDEGPGFSPDDLKKIYGKFQKLSARPTGGESSNGLGLATVSLLMKRLGGTMELKTNQDKGSVFILRI
jgi:signal transduction histidine kinase